VGAAIGEAAATHRPGDDAAATVVDGTRADGKEQPPTTAADGEVAATAADGEGRGTAGFGTGKRSIRTAGPPAVRHRATGPCSCLAIATVLAQPRDLPPARQRGLPHVDASSANRRAGRRGALSYGVQMHWSYG
jgi:hypothetical protein